MYLSDLLQNIYSDLGQTDPVLGNFIATGGSATTFVNTNWALLENPPEEDSVKGRYVFISQTTDGLTPQGKWSLVSGYVDATNTATFATVTDAVAAGDVLMLPKQDLFPLQQVIFCVNRALTNIGPILLVDTSLTGEADGVYDIPVALKGKLPHSVFYGSDTLGWTPVTDWRFEPAAAGSVGHLFTDSVPSGYGIKILYQGTHPNVSAYNSVIYEPIHQNVATLASIVEVLSWYNNRDENQGSNEYYLWLLGQKKQELALAKNEHPIKIFSKQARWATFAPNPAGEEDARNTGYRG